MASVTYEKVVKKYGDFTALHGIDLHIDDKEFLVLVGPSGCGKSTALRCLAGLEDISSGYIKIDDAIVNDVAPKDRDIAMVFQSYALYPHMSVKDNMAFGLKLRKMPKPEIETRVKEAADMLGLETMLERKPKQLSGGQRQRVALGRAIVRNPKVFLLDEPLSNLDAKLRVEMRANLSRYHQQLQTTFVYVTHDQVEAMTMASRIAVMNHGYLMQVDTPLHLYEKPANLFVAGFIGSPAMNFFNAKVMRGNGAMHIDAGSFNVRIPESRNEVFEKYIGKEVVFGMRPEDIHNPEFTPPSITSSSVDGHVDVMEVMGNEIFTYLNHGEHTFVARVDPRSNFRVGDDIQVAFNMDNMHVFDKDTEEAVR
ncbi:MAG TPA: sn-glycerol-3-phosphate ABC transporter ATP-binding protein UgpC [Anaerolineales bacterium]|nr:sn-glycerol-3-phosphate ABC transporter ATP-binding protein UgpC [Anaerolineales bacterium]